MPETIVVLLLCTWQSCMATTTWRHCCARTAAMNENLSIRQGINQATKRCTWVFSGVSTQSVMPLEANTTTETMWCRNKLENGEYSPKEERRVGKECRSRW